MSWLVRALIQQYRTQAGKMPRFQRPRRFAEEHCRFCLRLHGDKEELLLYTRSNGGEFSPFLRFILDLWERGVLVPDPESPQTTKTVKSIQLVKISAASDTHYFQVTYKKADYWPKNAENNLWLMELGLNSGG